MKNKDVYVDSHESTLSEISPVSGGAMTNKIIDLGCTFTKVNKNGKPALLACLNIQAQPTATDTLSAMLHHAEELNLRLPFLRVSVRTSHEVPKHYLFVLHGLSHHGITARNVSNFLNRLTHDFKVFCAYAEAHSIQMQPSLESATVKPFA